MYMLYEEIKPDVLLNASVSAGANATSKYVGLGDKRRILFAVDISGSTGLKKGEAVSISCLKAKDAAGTGATKITADVEVEGLIKGLVVATTVTGCQDTDTVTVNGVVFTKKTATPSAKKGEFADGAGLAAAIELLLPKLKATNDANTVTISAAELGEATITIKETIVNSTGTPWVPAGVTKQALALLEVYAPQMGAGYTHLAIKVDNDAATAVTAQVVAIRGDALHGPVYQPIAAGVGLSARG
ncbi:MAG: hypothetical protein PHH26_03845 [Candidatus Thermoplasmatota archaeon]|nr:hypothetical protein [Candidatus Thermoplasmatota archaeon]